MAFTKFRPRGDIKTNWEFKNPILARREIGVEWEQEIGKGNIKIKFGNGITAWNSLDYAVVDDITYKIIKVIATISEENPVLNAGETLDVLLGKIKKKFTYLENYIGDVKSLTNIFLPENIKTVAQALQNLIDNKIDNTKKYNGVDSTSTDLVPTANAVRIVNEKTENNKTAITTLNRDFGDVKTDLIKCWSETKGISVTANTRLDLHFDTTSLAGKTILARQTSVIATNTTLPEVDYFYSWSDPGLVTVLSSQTDYLTIQYSILYKD